mmetsp:Transcript_3957/g.7364  ORF Transcript_3957/g.7364 Transcript_3957/m.7364 type:complete len:364 (-) Transcript_3957:57-1148(-)|eukprot:CAMPEP_0183761006 /NCGR_PEP_ID=MMETSP0739-20130205/8138_1 /TAXON_ID=385413 /ORGANISM="Thalassiosira miniscula, Strain CCMP1093" /LENGTH=363 /DNA_ID=CAMNT_0025999071 /DNA_START=119 /DNA_END=1210 /DNA_ORIENTATION=-
MPKRAKKTAGEEDEEGEKLSGQELRALQERRDWEEKFHQEFAQFLSGVSEHPQMYAAPRLRYLRDFVSLAHRFPDVFRTEDGDDTITMPLSPGDRALEVTKGFVTSLAEMEVSPVDEPVLLVYATKPGYHNDTGLVRVDNPQAIKLTELRLCDGDGHQIHARLNNSLSEVGSILKRGDKIRLDLYTPLRYRINQSSPKMPALFIHRISRVGTQPLPDSEIREMLTCRRLYPREHLDNEVPDGSRFIIDPRRDASPVCNDSNRLCAAYGVRFLTCVCEAIPIAKLNLATIKSDCYFATDELESMTNSHKRNMIFWWYATNVYNIAGKGKIERLPMCLEYAVRKEYPNPDGVPYTGNRLQHKNTK